ncbi:MAG: PFL family protein [Anaerolineales bacterium]
MKLRTITTFLDPGLPPDEKLLDQAGHFRQSAEEAFTRAGYEVQTTRLATVPFPQILPNAHWEGALQFAQDLERAATARGFGYICIGPATPDNLAFYSLLPNIFANTQRTSASGVIADPKIGISLPAIRAAAEVIHTCVKNDPNGFGNFFFTALANVPPGGPFFPSGYHGGGPPAFALGTEAADLAVEAFSSAQSLAEARQTLITSIETHARRLEKISTELASAHGIRFSGIDFTLAPFPAVALSIGTALERLGVPALGGQGSVAAAAFLMDTLERAQFSRVGFNGLMLPVLEDATLAARAAEGSLTVTDLLLMSTVCGTGLDTVPLPGDTTPDQLAAILLDVAALSLRLNKPLTARLVPIPGKKAGDLIEFDFPYFANSRVMGVRSSKLGQLFAGDEIFRLKAR